MSSEILSESRELEQKITELKPGDHLCCIYETEQQHRALITPFIRKGLHRNEKVIYIVDARSAEDILDYLRENGLEIEKYLRTGQLMILSAAESYMREKVFDPDGMISLLKAETEKALQEGYSALRITGEMTWAMRGLPGSERLIEYETKLNRFFSANKCLAICQYDKRRFEPRILLDVLTTHPIAIIGTKLYENFYYIHPESLLGSNPESARLNNWLHNLQVHKKAEENLTWAKEETVRLARFPSENPNPVLRISKDGIILYANSASNMILDTWHCEVGQQLPQPCLQRAREVFASGEIFRFEFTCDDGTILLVTLSPVIEEGYLNAYGIDITEREQIEKELKKQKDFTETALDAQTDTFFVFEPQTGKAVRWNNAFSKASGYSDEEIRSMKAPDSYYNEEDLKKARAAIESILKQGTATIELSLITKDGTSIPTEYTSSVIKDDKGEPLYIIAMGRDIADRRKLELILKESEEKFRNLAEQSPNMIFIHQNNKILYVNQKCEEIMGYNRNVFYEDDFDFLTLIAPESRDLIKNNFSRHMKGKEAPPVEYLLITKKGRKIDAILTTKLMKYGGQAAILGTITDISLLKQAEKALRKSERELAIRNKIAEIFLTVPDEQMYSEVLHVILEAMESRHGVFGYIDENGSLIYPSLTTDIWDQCEMVDKDYVFPRETWGGIWGRAMIEKKTLYSNKSFNVPQGHIPMLRVLDVPILYHGRLIGNVMVGNKETDYEKEDCELLEAIADRIAPILASRLEKDKWDKERKKARDELEMRVENRTAELAKSRETLRMLTGQLLSVQEEERRRLARELHDDLTQRLAILAIDIGKLEGQLKSDTNTFAPKLKDIKQRIIDLSANVHDISRQLHPSIIDDLGLRQAIQSECKNFTKREGILINYHSKEIPSKIQKQISVCLFRTVQEGLRNIAKHANVKQANVSLLNDNNDIILTIEDSGDGFDINKDHKMGLGLVSMQERVHLISGSFSIKSKPGRGTKIKVTASLSGNQE
ncbi:MAG: MEDS domain-containing protein [Planctomycetota bacterium]|jgi:PAS domain S-box-containing protein